MQAAEPGLESAPPPDEGIIAEVDFEYENRLLAAAKECQQCGEPVARDGEHILATVWVVDSWGREHMRSPVFCDRECWVEWAQSSP